ncbi:unnamed protein product [Spirodela intermedia]|uniref:Uncharacterized protein n=1 Tax=Spirodela intermedia TaxID=51605 RepID=A0A7I8LK81_SPIIN|nr:unnamed protein product [Spirodela intermedia]
MVRQGMGKKEANGSSRKASSPADLPSPYGELGCELSREDLRETAYEIFVGACRATGGKPLTFISQSERAAAGAAVERSLSSSLSSSSSPSSPSPSLHRSLTSSAAHQVRRALGLKSKKSSGKDGSSSKAVKKQLTVGELMRVQMGISEQTDARIRRGLLRISAGQLGRRIESMILPLELLQQLRSSDFPDQSEYESWQTRYLKILDAGLLLHPHFPVEKSDAASQQLRRIIQGALGRPLETGMHSESMQALRNAAMAVACRSSDGSAADRCHWADGIPLNLHLYQMLLEACFDNEDGSVVEEIDEAMEQIKKTWVILGMNQRLHNLCFTLTLFQHFVATGQADSELIIAADNQLGEVAENAKTAKDPLYSKLLSSTLSLMMNWAEQRLLAYHDTFHAGNVDLMQSIVSLGVSSAKILAEDTAHEHRRRRREEVDVARSRVDAYIRSSLRTAFAERMEQADMIRRSMRGRPSPVLSILAKDVGILAIKEKEVFSPVLKRWHPLAAGIAVATLHLCYANELKQFVSGITELTPDTVEVLKAADKLEKDLVQIAVEDSVESEDGGKAIIREMPPFEAESAMARLARTWIGRRVDALSEWVTRTLQKEGNKENLAPAVDLLRPVEETIDAFFQLPIPMHYALLPELLTGLDRSVQLCISSTKAGRGTPADFAPELPPLTRCAAESKLWRKKEKPPNPQRSRSPVDPSDLAKLCAAMNTLHHIRTELERLEKRSSDSLRKSAGGELAAARMFELSAAACREGIQQLCEIAAYRIVFHELNHVLWDGLYVREAAAARVAPLLKELDLVLEKISSSLHNRVRNRAITSLMKASFEGFLLVLLAGGPSRAFSIGDSQILEDDFRALRELYLADGDGLPEEIVDKAAAQARELLPLFRVDTETLISRFRAAMVAYGGASRSKLQLPPTPGRWSPSDPNTLLRVLCHRNDEPASKFLKKTYGLPKKL